MTTLPDAYIRHAIREHGFVPGRFSGSSHKQEVLKIDIPPIMRDDKDFRLHVSNKMAGFYLRHIHPQRPATHVGGISEGGEWLTQAFNQALVRHEANPMLLINFPKSLGTAGNILNGFIPARGETGHLLILDDVLNRAGSALRSIRKAREERLEVTDFITLILRHEDGVNALKATRVHTHACFTVGQVISKANAEGWKAFYDEYPLGYPPEN